MSDLVIPRRLAIALLAEAQKAPDGRVTGLIGAQGDHPVAIFPVTDLETLRARGHTLWAVFHSEAADLSPAGRDFAVPELVISLDTKGVLQLRCADRDVRIAES